MTVENEPLLSVRNLHTYFAQDEGMVKAVDGVSLEMSAGATLGVVGESGCGKSVTARSILRIVDRPGRIVAGEIWFRRPTANGGAGSPAVDLAKLEPNSKEMRSIRGAEIALIFQEPMSSFSPVHSVGNQIIEAIVLHEEIDRRGARAKAIEMLRRGGVSSPDQRIDQLANQLSGWLRMRARSRERLTPIAGSVPHPYDRPEGCPFHPRCPDFMPGTCDRQTPELRAVGDRHTVSCFLYP